MSNANPTPIRIGTTGSFGGKSYTIIARVVMGMEDAGETYFWNEFYLSDGSDRIAMLVCEEVYGAQQWRLFTEFTPATPLTAREAGLKQVGETVSLDGVSAEVTVVDQTRVYYIEGKAPDWVSVADEAQYFNAEAGGKMWVVSWSGDEVEYYKGMQLHPDLVAQALNLPVTSFKTASASSGSGGGGGLSYGVRGALFAIAVIGITAFNLHRVSLLNPKVTYSSIAPPPNVQRQSAPPAPLTVGTNITLDGQAFRVVGQRVVAYTKVNAQWNSHQYQVTDDAGQTNLLVLRALPNASAWHLFKSVAPARPPTPLVAAAMRVGEGVTVADFSGSVSELFMSSVLTNRSGFADSGSVTGHTYHYLATDNAGLLLASWTRERVHFHRGQPVAKHTP